MSKTNKTQVVMKTDTTENWAKCEHKYIPAPFTILVYQDEGQEPKVKISDGIHTLGDLEFIHASSKSEVHDSVLYL